MANEIALYTNPRSRGRIALWMLEEIGVPFHVIYLDFGSEMKSDTYRAINPLGKVPAVTHAGNIITEAAAICCYLAEAFPEAEMAPPPGGRADFYRWMFFAAGPVDMSFTNDALDVHVPEEMRHSVGYSSKEETTDILADQLSRSAYLAGDTFTAVDVMLGTEIGWYMDFGIIEKRPPLIDYARRLSQRPAFQRAKARDEAALRKAEGTSS